MIESFIEYGISIIDEQRQMNRELKQRALAEYEAALTLPRKKKKKAKKSALLLYSISTWGEKLLS